MLHINLKFNIQNVRLRITAGCKKRRHSDVSDTFAYDTPLCFILIDDKHVTRQRFHKRFCLNNNLSLVNLE